MKIDFSQPILDLDNNPVEDLTLGKIVVNALMAQYQDEGGLSGEEKLERFRVAQIAHAMNGAEITVEQASMIKKVVAKGYGPLIVGRVYALIK